MQDRELFEAITTYKGEDAYIAKIIKIYEEAEKFLAKLEELESFESPIIRQTNSVSTIGGDYASPTYYSRFSTTTRTTY